MNDEAVCRTAPATPGLLIKDIVNWDFRQCSIVPFYNFSYLEVLKLKPLTFGHSLDFAGFLENHKRTVKNFVSRRVCAISRRICYNQQELMYNLQEVMCNQQEFM